MGVLGGIEESIQKKDLDPTKNTQNHKKLGLLLG